MKPLITFLVITLLVNIGQSQILQSSFFLNLGSSIPTGKYRASGNSQNALEIARADDPVSAFNMGMDLYYKNIGLTTGISNSTFVTNKNTFERIHYHQNNLTDSYLRNHSITKIYGGFTYRLNYKRFNVEPRILLSLTSYSFGMSEFYQKDTEGGEIFKTIQYTYGYINSITVYPAVNLNFDLVSVENISASVQMFIEYHWWKPKVNYEQTYSSKPDDIIIKTDIRRSQNTSYVYLGFGMMFKIKEKIFRPASPTNALPANR